MSQAETVAPPKPAAPSPVEGFKANSHNLRGTIAQTIASGADHFEEADKQLLKFHGTYQQEDRDARKNRSTEGVAGKHYMFMIRARIPGGMLTPDQWLTLDDLAGKYANNTVRLTSRQSIQYHGVVMKGLKETIAEMNAALVSTLSACGDVNRNVMACPAPLPNDPARAAMQKDCHALAMHLAPKTGAYHEIWINGVQQDTAASEVVDPIYGKLYLPRKFKVAFGLPDDNCVDIHAQCLGFLAIVEKGKLLGYNVLVGGGQGMTHGKATTFPNISQSICFITREQVLAAGEAVIKLFRDHGNRSDRKRARIKYLVADWGVDKFRETLAPYLPFPLVLPKSVDVSALDLHLGWNAQGDGKFWYGLSVENGRVKDDGDCKLRTAVRQIVKELRPEVRLTPMQDLLFCQLPESAHARILQILKEHGVQTPEKKSPVRTLSMACPAIPTCALAICESERALPTVIDEIEPILKDLGLENEAFGIRMTGCPNGCVRPYQSEIGLVGRSGDKYVIFVGGHKKGSRLNFIARDLVPRTEIATAIKPLLVKFKAERQNSEDFGDFCHRIGQDACKATLAPAPVAAAVPVA